MTCLYLIQDITHMSRRSALSVGTAATNGAHAPETCKSSGIFHRVLGAVFAIALTACSSAPTATAPFDRAAWKADLTQLKKALEAQYANLAWKASDRGDADLPALSRDAELALDRADTDARATDAVRAFVAGFHDGHLSELPKLAVVLDAAAEPSPPLLDVTDPAGGCAALGFAPNGATAFSMPFETLPGFSLVSDGSATTFRSGVLRPRQGVVLGFIRLHAFRASAYSHVCISAWNALFAAGKPITANSVRKAARSRWFDDLAASIRALRTAGAEALVIDVGNNSGGDDSGDWTPRLLTAKPVNSARLLMVDAPVAARYFDEQLELLSDAVEDAPPNERAQVDVATAFFKRQKSLIGQHSCDLSWVWREQRSWTPGACNRLLDAGYADGFSAGPSSHLTNYDVSAALSWAAFVQPWSGTWTGPTYVVTDRRTYSSAEMFAALVQDNGAGKIVGTRTGGDGCGFMADGPPIVLEHSGLRFRVPNCMRLRKDGSDEEAGVDADLRILPSTGESARARAQRAATAIADDLRFSSVH